MKIEYNPETRLLSRDKNDNDYTRLQFVTNGYSTGQWAEDNNYTAYCVFDAQNVIQIPQTDDLIYVPEELLKHHYHFQVKFILKNDEYNRRFYSHNIIEMRLNKHNV